MEGKQECINAAKQKMAGWRAETEQTGILIDEIKVKIEIEKRETEELFTEITQLTKRRQEIEERQEGVDLQFITVKEQLNEKEKQLDESRRYRRTLEQQSPADENKIAELEKEIASCEREKERFYTMLVGCEAKLKATEERLDRVDENVYENDQKSRDFEFKVGNERRNEHAVEMRMEREKYLVENREEELEEMTKLADQAEEKALELEEIVRNLELRADELSEQVEEVQQNYRQIQADTDAMFTGLLD